MQYVLQFVARCWWCTWFCKFCWSRYSLWRCHLRWRGHRIQALGKLCGNAFEYWILIRCKVSDTLHRWCVFQAIHHNRSLSRKRCYSIILKLRHLSQSMLENSWWTCNLKQNHSEIAQYSWWCNQQLWFGCFSEHCQLHFYNSIYHPWYYPSESCFDKRSDTLLKSSDWTSLAKDIP